MSGRFYLTGMSDLDILQSYPPEVFGEVQHDDKGDPYLIIVDDDSDDVFV